MSLYLAYFFDSIFFYSKTGICIQLIIKYVSQIEGDILIPTVLDSLDTWIN